MQPRDFSLYGAVDLGARQAAVQRREQPAQSGDSAAPGGGAVIEVTEETFNTDVVERYRTTPVIMDLSAEWCGPWKQLSPELEKLAAEAAGQWILAKVDVDANPQLSAALQVQSIPMVVAVVGGQLVDGFVGAMPEAQVRQWIGQVLVAAEKMGMSVAGGPVAEADDEADEADQDAPGAQEAGLPAPPNRPPTPPNRSPGRPGRPPRAPPLPPIPPAYAEARAAMERGEIGSASWRERV